MEFNLTRQGVIAADVYEADPYLDFAAAVGALEAMIGNAPFDVRRRRPVPVLEIIERAQVDALAAQDF